tara:strand:+ start:1069 stop:1251 length:183 start_codon:yes stop_codon:yes gene_type:complete
MENKNMKHTNDQNHNDLKEIINRILLKENFPLVEEILSVKKVWEIDTDNITANYQANRPM